MGSGAASGNLLVHFGKQLRRLRLEAGLTQDELGRSVGYSAALIGMVETGRRMPSLQMAIAADRMLHARGSLEGLWSPLRERCAPNEQFEELVEQELTAVTIDSYESQVVPGMLQTEEYTRALVHDTRPRLTGSEIEKRVTIRLSRQQALTKPDPPRCWAILGETALRQERGGRTVMQDQLRHLLDTAGSPEVTLQVLPFTAVDPTWGMSFSVLRYGNESTVVYLDTFPVGIYRSAQGGDITRCQALFDHLRESALSEPDSLELISQRADELG